MYSHTYQEKAFDFFASFIRNVLNGDGRYVTMVQSVINDAKSLATNEKDHFSVDRKAYDLIVYLAEKDSDFFKHLDTSHLTQEQYQYILELLTEQQEMIFA
jgi:hypothetical protein